MTTRIHKNSKKAFLIVNKFAGHRKKIANSVNTVVSVFQKNNWQVEFAFTQFHGHASQLASDAATSGFDMVIAAGGDGTVNEVVQGLIGKSIPMGIIPLGSGNGLAREMGIPMNISKSAHTLISGNKKQIDICRINNQHFLCTSGIGLDAQIADKMAKAKSRGFIRYIKLTIKESIGFNPFKIKMKVDEFWIEKNVFLVTFANARQFGNNAFIAPKANISDGLIDVVVVNPFPKIWLPVFGIGLFLSIIHKLPFVEYYKAKKINIEYSESNVYHFDGEPGIFSLPAKLNMDSQKLLIISGK